MVTFVTLSLVFTLLLRETRSDIGLIRISNRPIPITKHPLVFTPKDTSVEEGGPQYTLTFWLHFNTKSINSDIHILSLLNMPLNNSLIDEEKLDFVLLDAEAKCPHTKESIFKDSKIADLPEFMANPSCQILNEFIKKQTQAPIEPITFRLNRKMSNVELKVAYINRYDNVTKTSEFDFEEFQFSERDENCWVFVALSLNFIEGKGSSFVQVFAEKIKNFKRKFEISIIEKILLQNFYFQFSDNSKLKNEPPLTKGIVYEPNFYFKSFENSDLLLFVDHNIPENLYQSLSLDASFTLELLPMMPIVKLTGLEEFNDHINIKDSKMDSSKANYLALIKSKDSLLPSILPFSIADPFKILIKELIGNEDKDNFDFVFAPTVFLEIEIMKINFKNLLIFKFFSRSTSTNISLFLNRYNEDEAAYCTVMTTIAMDGMNSTDFISPAIEISGRTLTLSFSLASFLSTYFKTLLIVNSKYHFMSNIQTSRNFDIRTLDLSLEPFSSEDNIKIHRVVFIEHANGIIASALFPVNNNSSIKCKIPIEFTDNGIKDCIKCNNLSVRDPISDSCHDHCPTDTKNIFGSCWPCGENCSQSWKPLMEVIRISNSNFWIKLEREIYNFQLLNATEILIISLKDAEGEVSFELKANFISGTIIFVELNIARSAYNALLTVSLKGKAESQLYDVDKNFLESFSIQKKISCIRRLTSFASKLTEILAYILGGFFYITLVIAVALFLMSMKYNLNSFSCKKFILNIQMLQLLPFLLFLNINYPSNLNSFLSKAYQLIIELSMLNINNNHSSESFIEELELDNMADNHVTPEFLNNIGILFIFHCGALVVYTSLTIVNCFFKYLPGALKRYFGSMRNFFELNILMTTLILFDHEILVFAVISVTSPHIEPNTGSKFSMIFSLIYLGIYMLSVIVFFILLFFKRDKFSLHDKFRNLFAEKSPLYFENTNEIFQITTHFIFAIVLVLLRKQPLLQIMIFFIVQVVLFYIAGMVLTFEHTRDFIFEMISRFIFMTIVLVLMIFAFEDRSQLYNHHVKEVLGWVAISLIGLLVMFNYTIDFYHLIHFIRSKNSKSSRSSDMFDRSKNKASVSFDNGSPNISILDSYISGKGKDVGQSCFSKELQTKLTPRRRTKDENEDAELKESVSISMKTPKRDDSKVHNSIRIGNYSQSLQTRKKVGLLDILEKERNSSERPNRSKKIDPRIKDFSSNDPNKQLTFSFASKSKEEIEPSQNP
jgi:hypothetical protein